MNSRRVAGMPTSLSFITLNNFLRRNDVVSIKLTQFVFFYPFVFI